MSAEQPLGQMIIELGIDSTNFSSGMKGINQQIKSSMTDMKAHLNVMGRSGEEIDKLKAKQTGLTSVMAAQNQKVELAKSNYEACKAAVEGNAEATHQQKDALIRARDEYVRAIGELGSYENQLREVNIRLTAMESSIYKTGDVMVRFGQNMTKVGDIMTKAGKALTAGVTMPIVALGTSSLKVATDFESAMSQVQATMGITKDSVSMLGGQSVNTMETLGKLAKQMGAETKFTASEAAAAVNNMAMAGYDTQQIYDTLPHVLNLAAAGALDLDYATQLAANGLNVMGLKTSDLEELSDKLAVTASSAYGSVSDFGEGLLKAGGQASIANINLTDTMTALGILGDAGMAASEGGTNLRNVIKNLYTPTSTASKALEGLGVATANSDGTLKDFQVVLQELDCSLSGLTADEKVNAMSTIFDTRTIAAANALLEASGERFDELSAKIEASGGAAQAMTDTQLDNLSGQLTILKSGTEAIGISFGEIMLPAIKNVTTGLQSLTDWMNSLDEKQKQTIVRVASVAAVVGPVVLITGKLTSGIGNLVTNTGKAMEAFALWSAKITVNAAATGAHATATTADTAVTQANTAANAGNSAGLVLKTAKVLAVSAASKLHTVVETAQNVALRASNGVLLQQVTALNTSILTKGKDTVATVTRTTVEKLSSIQTGISTGQLSLQTIATSAQTVATGALTVATGFLSAAIKLLLGPIGWAVAAIALLVTGAVAAVKWLTKETEASKELTTETEALAEANNTLTESLDSSKSAYDDKAKSIKTETEASKILADKVAELVDIEDKSAQQKKELSAYVGMLNNSMAGLNLQYDEQADALSMTTDEIRRQINALEQQAQAQAAQERLTEILKEKITVEEQLTQVQDKVTAATQNTALREGERKKIVKELTEQEAGLQSQLESLASSQQYVAGMIVSSAVEEAQVVEKSSQTILEAYGSIGKAYEDLGKQQKQAVDGITNTYETMTGKLSDLTKKIKLDNETTWKEIQKNQADTITKTKEFSELYAQLIEAGVSESYLNAIGATGPESIPLLKGMLKGGTDAVLASQYEWQEAYSVIGDTLISSLTLDDTVSGAVKDYILGESGVYGTLQGAIDDADLDALGKSLTDGVAAGILKNTDNLESTATGMADATTDAAKTAWDINSPSGVFEELGGYLMEGLSQGMTNGAGQVYVKAAEIANNVTKTMKTALDIHSPSGIMRDEVGKNIALGIAEGITQNKDYAKKSAEDIADAVVSAAQKKLDNTKVYNELTLADEVAFWDSVRQQVTEGTQARIDADKKYFDAKKSLSQEIESLNTKMVDLETDYAAKIKKVNADLQSSIQSLQDSYDSALESRIKSITSSMSLFEEFSASTALTTADLLNNLSSQVLGLKDWSNNLKELEKRGVTGGMLEELEGLGTSAAGEIALMTEMTDEELKEYVALWKEKQKLATKQATKELEPMADEVEQQIYEMRIAAAKELEEYKNEFVSAMAEIGEQIQAPLKEVQTSLLDTMSMVVQLAAGTVSTEADKQSNVSQFAELAASVFQASASLPSDFTSLGVNTIEGMIQGLQSKAGSLYQTMTEIIREAIQAARDEAQIHSPSRVMMSIGSYLVEGVGVGMKSMQSYVEGVVHDMTGAITESWNTDISSATLPTIDTTVLTEKTGVIQSIKRILESLGEEETTSSADSDHNNLSGLLAEMLTGNQTMITLLQTIAGKDSVIDKSDMVDVVDSGIGGTQQLKVRRA